MEREVPVETGRTKSAPALCCPACGAALDRDPKGASCPGCSQRYGSRWGVPDLLPDQAYYFGEIVEDKMDALLADVERAGVREALLQHLPRHKQAVASYVLDDRRTDLRFLLPLNPDAAVLDVGCGWGTISMALAQDAGFVAGVDATPQRAAFLGAWAREQGLQHVEAVRGNALNPPYPAESFDAALLNGVLEWVAEFDRAGGPPREVQLRALCNIAKRLKPGGTLAVAIENRIGLPYFFGIKDHGGTRFTTLMPRWLASLASRIVRKTPYRVYTYTLPGFRRLFREAGFEVAAEWATLPSYVHPRAILPVGADRARAHWRRAVSVQHFRANRIVHKVYRALDIAGVGRFFSPSFLFVLRRPGRDGLSHSFADALLADLRAKAVPGTERLGAAPTMTLIPGRPGPNRSVTFLIYPTGFSRPLLAVRVARRRSEPRPVEREARALETATRQLQGGPAGHLILAPLAQGTTAGHAWVARAADPGTSQDVLLHRPAPGFLMSLRLGRLARAAGSGLASLEAAAGATSQASFGSLLLSDLIPDAGPREVSRALAEAYPQLAAEGGRIQERLAQVWQDDWRVVPVHGDYRPVNLFQDGRGTRALDWETFMPRGPAGLDAYTWLYALAKSWGLRARRRDPFGGLLKALEGRGPLAATVRRLADGAGGSPQAMAALLRRGAFAFHCRLAIDDIPETREDTRAVSPYAQEILRMLASDGKP